MVVGTKLGTFVKADLDSLGTDAQRDHVRCNCPEQHSVSISRSEIGFAVVRRSGRREKLFAQAPGPVVGVPANSGYLKLSRFDRGHRANDQAPAVV